MPSPSSLSKTHHHRGILSVLDSDHNNVTVKVANSSLRRTLSADMSSQAWREQSGFSAIHGGSKDGGEKCHKTSHFNSWFSPLNPKTEPDPPPYVHPLVKRSASAASLKSLEACTESLGSESGSDGFTFSSLPGSDKEEEEEEEKKVKEKEQVATASDVEKMIQFTRKKRHHKPFPPPLPSLSCHQDGQPLHVRSLRNCGRLVLEASAVPVQSKNFKAQREDGRLLLAFSDHAETDQLGDKEEEMGDRKEVEQQQGEKEEDQTQVLKSCKDPRTSLVSWERSDDILVSLSDHNKKTPNYWYLPT